MVTYVTGSLHHRTLVVANSVVGGSFSRCWLQQICNLVAGHTPAVFVFVAKNGKSFNQCIKKIHPVSEKASMAMKKSFIGDHLLQTLLVFATTDDQFFCIADDRSSAGKVHVDDKVVICCNPQLAKLPPMIILLRWR